MVHTTNKSWSLVYLIPKPLGYVMSMRRFRYNPYKELIGER